MHGPSQARTCGGSQRARCTGPPASPPPPRPPDRASPHAPPPPPGRWERHQHRQAVGHLHGAGHARLVGPGSVGLRRSRHLRGRHARPAAVHLAQPHGRAPGPRSAPVLGHGQRLVADRPPRFRLSQGARLTPPARVLISAPTRGGAGHRGRSSRLQRPPAQAASGQASGRVFSKASSFMQARRRASHAARVRAGNRSAAH